ncbi:MAG: hypothetical protein RLZZ436_2823 [Planctomycetota bacterium]
MFANPSQFSSNSSNGSSADHRHPNHQTNYPVRTVAITVVTASDGLPTTHPNRAHPNRAHPNRVQPSNPPPPRKCAERSDGDPAPTPSVARTNQTASPTRNSHGPCPVKNSPWNRNKERQPDGLRILRILTPRPNGKSGAFVTTVPSTSSPLRQGQSSQPPAEEAARRSEDCTDPDTSAEW